MTGEISVNEVINQLNDKIEEWLSLSIGIDIQSFAAYTQRNSKNNGGFIDGMESTIFFMNMKEK